MTLSSGAGGAVTSDETGGEARFVHDQFRSLVGARDFPCLGARAAINQGTYRFGLYDMLGSQASAEELASDLAAFLRERRDWDSTYSTYVAAFRGPRAMTEAAFEHGLWETLGRLRANDEEQHEWDARVSSDPHDPRFSFSFGGEAMFVVGLHGSSSRYARTFAWPTLCFNPHDQFESIRASGNFGRIRRLVRERDRALQGHVNPMLRDFGDVSEAAQYSGRVTDEGWRPPIDCSSW
ncbi:MAG: guanitoxin biosynthesis heme-dependent pre-guanitoxin N-hydroxylase GntA [Candidatus Dormibacteria bacterium]